MKNQQKIYFYGLITIVIINLSPLKSVAYFSSIIFCFPFIFTNSTANRNFFLINSFLLILSLFYSLIYDEFIFQSFIIACITYSSILPILLISNFSIAGQYLQDKVYDFIFKIFKIESIIGIIQAIYGFVKSGSFDLGNGDYVEGTIHPQLESEGTFANPMYFCNMACILVFLIAVNYSKTKVLKLNYWYFLGILSMILASVVHSLVILVVSVLVSFVYIRPKIFSKYFSRNSKIKILIIFIFTVSSSVFLLRKNLSGIIDVAEIYLQSNESNRELPTPRNVLTRQFYNKVAYEVPVAPYIGLGLGQFSSRASLMSSGKYLGRGTRSIPFLSPVVNKYAKKYVIPKQIELIQEVNFYGSSQQPFFSFFSLLTEIGLIGVVVFCFFLVRLLLKLKYFCKNDIYLGMGAIIIIVYLFGLGIQENYYEVPQAILIPILLFKILSSNTQYNKKYERKSI